MQRPSHGARGTASLEQELDLAMLARYDAADISAPDFSYSVVSPLAAWRIYEVASHVGMGLTMHSAYDSGPVPGRAGVDSRAQRMALPVRVPYFKGSRG